MSLLSPVDSGQWTVISLIFATSASLAHSKLSTVHCALLLKLQAGFAGGVGQCLDAPVVEVAAAIEDHLLDALFHSQLGHCLADFLGRCQVAACLHFGSQRGGRNQRLTLLVVDYLRVDVAQRTVYIQPRPLARAGKLGPDACVNALANCVSLGLRDHCLSFLSAEPPGGPVRVIS